MQKKQSVLVLWVVLLGVMFFASGWVAGIARFAFWAMALAHVAEFFVKRSVLEKAGGSMVQHFVQTLIYGLFHWKPLEAEQLAADAGSSEGV